MILGLMRPFVSLISVVLPDATRLVQVGGLAMACGVVSCASSPHTSTASREILVSVKDQKLALMEQGKPVAVYPVSTSKFCLSDTPGSYGTPLGRLRVAQKIGGGAPAGAVFKHRQPTGEVLPPNAPGRDPIVTRILRLTGSESRNARAFARNIYIHGTPEESTIGQPASYGCVRMKSEDVIDLYNRIPNGTDVTITKGRLPAPARTLALRSATPPPAAAPTPTSTPTHPFVARLQKLRPAPAKHAVATTRTTATYGPPVP